MRTLLALLLFASSSIVADAQTLMRGRSRTTTVGIEFQKPKFAERNDEYSGLIYTVAADIVVSPAVAVIGRIPFVAGSITTAYYSYEETAAGNPYLGLQFGAEASEWFGEAGVRIPLIDARKDLAASVAALTDMEHFEAYIPHTFQVSAAANVETEIAPMFWFLARLGPSVDFYTEGSRDADIYADYGAAFQLRQVALTLGGAYSARTFLKESSLDDHTIDQFTVSGSYRFSKLEPTLFAKIPLDESYRRQLDVSYGLSLRVIL